MPTHRTYGKYSIILADPPWNFSAWSGNNVVGRAIDRRNGVAMAHYQTMSTDQICSLPVNQLAAKDCVLFLWATWPTMPDALEVIKAWGFCYKTVAFVWVKQNASGWGTRMGMGYWTRANTEMCLLATTGKPHRANNSVKQVVFSSVRQHSRKPDEVHHKIVDLMGDLPRVELFARRPFAGWDVLGDAIDGRDLQEVLTQATPAIPPELQPI